MMMRVVVDTSVFVSALLRADTGPRQVLRLCLQRQLQPLMGNPLLSEFEDVLARDGLFVRSLLTKPARQALLEDFLSVCSWVNIYYLWRPNLRDEADNHLIELALAGGASHLITGNLKDFEKAELTFPELTITTANGFMNAWRKQHGNHDHPPG